MAGKYSQTEYRLTAGERPRMPRTAILICLAIVAFVLALVGFEDAGEILSVTPNGWLAVGGALFAGAHL